METELKFALSSDARERIERRLRIGSAERASKTRHARSAYFDTSDLALRRAGYSLRIRHHLDSNRFVQTMKSRGNGGLQRGEWEWPVVGERPELKYLSEVPGLPSTLRRPDLALEQVFETDVDREVEIIVPEEGTRVEVAFDHGIIAAGAKSEPLSELELELKEGAVDSLLRLGLDFLRAAPLALMSESKAERGYRLYDGSLPQAIKAPAVQLDADADVGSAFRMFLASALDHLMANQPAAIRGEQVEGMHQMRVAIRRLRSLLIFFEPYLEARTASCFEAELKRLGRLLGTARDWDVFVTETLQRIADDGADRHWIAVLRERACEKQHAAHQAGTKAVLEPEYARFVLALSAWSRCGDGAFQDGEADRRLAKLAPDVLDRLAGKTLKRAAKVDSDDPESLHALRKSAKKLRYGIEYLQGLYGDDTKSYRKRCHKLQKHLGRINDLETALRLGVGLTEEGRTDLAPALALLAHWSETRLRKLRKGVGDACSAFESERPFW